MSVNYKKIIADTLLDLSQTVPLRKIKTKDLIEASGVSRQTFYNHFENRNDLFTWIYRTRIIPYNDPLAPPADFYHNLLAYYRNLYKHRSFISAAAKLEDSYSLRQAMEDFSMEWFARYLGDFCNVPVISLFEFAARYNVHGFVDTTLSWILGGMQESPERMALYRYHCIPTILQPYLPGSGECMTRESLQCGFANPQYHTLPPSKAQYPLHNAVRIRFSSALVSLCQEKSIDTITVQELLDYTQTGRQTFYSNFRDKNDLIQWTFKNQILYLGFDGTNFEQCWVHYFLQLEQYKEFITQAGRLTGHNCLREYMRSCTEEWYHRQYFIHYGSDQVPAEIAFAIRFHAYGIADSIIDWCSYHHPVSPESMAKWVCACQPPQMQIYPFIRDLQHRPFREPLFA